MNNKTVLTWTGGGGSLLSRPTESGATHCNPSAWTKSRAFTMAEILLSLTIIGVVAAITLPSLTGNINERTWNTQRKALYARFSQAISLMPALNGYGKLTGTFGEDGSQSVTEDTAAETFITDGLAKVLKINNICDSDHLKDCGLSPDITTLAGNSMSMPNTFGTLNQYFTYAVDTSLSYSYAALDTKAAAFETANGESVLVFYNPNCIMSLNQESGSDVWWLTQPYICANFVYDLNGNKGPNTVGKDIGVISAMYPTDTVVVAPVPVIRNAEELIEHRNAPAYCTKYDSDTRMPNIEELIVLFINQDLFDFHSAAGVWSSTLASANTAYAVGLGSGRKIRYSRGDKLNVRCIKR
ncbi:MAG: prepilin-type N-terminal cleavage/methylation domain-containing protein [Fusobacterium sp.]|nr:prepilin-type N-terminal cleavage/methylation domain-containing protein [Fusobacterium sp.]